MRKTPKRNYRRTPQRRLLKKISGIIKHNPIKRLKKMKTYESPLKHFEKNGKRVYIDDLAYTHPIKRQKLSRQRESVIIINDENDVECSRPMITRSARKRNSKNLSKEEKIPKAVSRLKNSTEIKNDSIIILEDDENQRSVENLNQNDDVMVVWSSVPDTPKQTNEIQNPHSSTSDPFVIDNNPTVSNLTMLRGDYPQKWLGDWLSEEKKNTITKTKKSPAKSKKKQTDKKKKKTAIENEQAKQSPTQTPKQKKTEIEETNEATPGKLREIIIDGLNVGRSYSNGKFFSEDGLKLVVDFFKERGHPVKVFVPQHVRRRNRQVLENLHKEGHIVFTPSRKAGSKSITPYEDRFILEYATKCDGIVVSNDQFKDLYKEKPEWRETIEKRILPATFAGEYLMFPEDPLGRNGPKLDKFLRHET